MKKNSQKFLPKILSVLTVAFLIIYLGWRIIYTLPDYKIYGWVAFIAGIGLVIAEGISVIEALVHYWNLNRQYTPPMPQIPDEWYPDVDVMIATHNEDEDLLFKTVNACTRMKYPDKTKVHIHICDDTNRAEIKLLAEKLHVNYFGLSDNKLAKAGNLNNAIGKTNAPLIVTFDADMIPNSNFLLETVPYFFLPKMKQDDNGNWIERTPDEIDEKFKVGFIQTPQTFYNPDLFQYNLYSENRIPNEQDYFFRQVNVGKNRANAPIYAGSNTVISREALEEIGGICTGTITEDFETGLLIESNGYSCYAIDKMLAKGLAPITVKSLIKQRERWGRGCIYSLRRVHILLNPRFSLRLKLEYFACRLYWGSFTRKFIYILSPILFVLFDIPVVVASLKALLLIWLPAYILYGFTLKKISGEIRNTRWSDIIDTTIFPYMLLPLWAESLFIQKKEFHVTSKAKIQSDNDVYMALPHVLLLILCVYSLFNMVQDLFLYKAFGSIIVIYWLIINSSSLIMAIFFMLGRRNDRMTERFTVDLPVEIQYNGNVYHGNVVDISEGGFAMIMDSPIYLPHANEDEQDAFFYIQYNSYYAKVAGKIVTVMNVSKRDEWKYCVSVTEIDEDNLREYLQIIYDREHSLPKKISKKSSHFGDIVLNLTKRTTDVEQSRRQTARIVVNETCQLEDGRNVLLENYNFEFVRISSVGEEALPQELTLFPGSKYEMHCLQSGVNANVYSVTNWEAVMNNPDFNVVLKEWKKNTNARKR